MLRRVMETWGQLTLEWDEAKPALRVCGLSSCDPSEARGGPCCALTVSVHRWGF